jgi:hypothetical protein
VRGPVDLLARDVFACVTNGKQSQQRDLFNLEPSDCIARHSHFSDYQHAVFSSATLDYNTVADRPSPIGLFRAAYVYGIEMI